MPELYTVQEVAQILKTSVDYVYKLQKSGLLKFLKIGRLKCRRETLEEFISKYDGMDISDPFNVREIEES
jgi:excisionase family DNA binding protein